MVKVIDYLKRQAENGTEFFVLVLQGGIEFVRSQQTGKFYMTARKCSIPTTFDEQVCKAMIGENMQGKIVKVDCEAYDYVIQETQEVIQLSHTYEFIPDGEEDYGLNTVNELLKEFKPSQNGHLVDSL